MALATPCQTPGAHYNVHIGEHTIVVHVNLGADTLHLSHRSAELLEANLHNAVELVLSRYYALEVL
jgi:hypothetical protein